MEAFWQDVRYAARSLRKQALLSIAVVATLTLGISVSTGVFTKYNAEYLRTHVDKDLDSFVRVYTAYTRDSTSPGRLGEMTLEDYLAFRDRAKSLRNLAAYVDIRGVRLGKDDPKDVRTLLVTSNFFSVYDLEQPLMGRLLQPEDYVAANPVVVLSERLWRNRFAADPQIVGKVTHFNDQPVTVVGVTPNFVGMINGASAWFPYKLETYLKHGDDLLRPGEAAWLNVVGRLNPGFSRRDAAAELRLLASQQDRLHAGRTTTLTITDGSWFQDPEDRGNNRMVFAALLGALLIFVLIACLNVTTLLLARAAARRQEIAMRLALGAGKMRLVRMLVTETFLLASVAGLASLYLTHQIPGILDKLLTNNSEGAGADFSQAPDWRVFTYLALVTVLAAMVAGLTPAFQSLKVNFVEMLKGRQSNLGGARGPRLYGLLIGAQIALSFCLLYLAGLFVSVAQNAASFEPGFETRQVISTGLFIQSKDVGSEPRNWGPLHHTLAERLRAMPGVQSVAHSKHFQFINVWATRAQGHAMRQAATSWVSSNYFTTLGIPIVSGRALREDDPACGRAVCSVVVSQQLAREFWPDENPLGQTLQDRQNNSFEVVGVARDISSMRLGLPDDPMIYQPLNLRGAQFGVNVRDPISYAMTAILLGGVALAAMLVPARRATRVDPMIALREE